MEYKEKIVRFDEYCDKCKHKELEDYKDPCNDCLNNPVNINSRRPVNYESKEE